MISIITVIIESLNKYLPYLEKSIRKHLTLVDEIIIPRVDIEPGYYRAWALGKINCIEFGAKTSPIMDHHSPALHCLHHALGLHSGIDRAKNDLVMLCDPDIFFQSDVDKFYVELMEKYNLNCIGLSHPASLTQAFTFFPNVLNCLMKKSEMPDESFLNDKLNLYNATPTDSHQWALDKIDNIPLKGKFLIPSKMPETGHYFPNPEGYYETGCQLVIWAKEKNWKWLSFQTPDCSNYSSQYFRSNFKINDKMPRRKLLYHVMHGAVMKERFDIYEQQYKESEID